MAKREKRSMQKQRKRIRLSNAILEIRKQYKNIRQEDIIFAAMVFYPIAYVEVEAEERSVESFDEVQFTILKFFAMGLEGEDIATLTGLTPEYIAQVKNLLVNVYGHIDANGSITPLGWESINRGQNVQFKLTKRNIHLDAITFAVIPHKQRVDENVFYDKVAAHEFNVGVMAYPDGITKEALENRLKGEGVLDDDADMAYDKIIGARNIHVNINTIKNVQCLKLHYAISCMLILDGGKLPIVFGKRASHQAWLPFGVESEALCQRYGLEPNVKSFGESGRYLSAMRKRFDDAWEKMLKDKYESSFKKKYKTITEDEKRKVNKQCIWDAIKFFCSFQKGHYRWEDEELYIDGEAFGSAKQGYAIAKILAAFIEEGVYRFAAEDLCGHLVNIRPEEDDELLKEVARLLKEAIAQRGASKVDFYLRENFTETIEMQPPREQNDQESGTSPSEEEMVKTEAKVEQEMPEEEKKPLVLEQMKQVLLRFLEEGQVDGEGEDS